jgi:hypothetical protein
MLRNAKSAWSNFTITRDEFAVSNGAVQLCYAINRHKVQGFTKWTDSKSELKCMKINVCLTWKNERTILPCGLQAIEKGSNEAQKMREENA